MESAQYEELFCGDASRDDTLWGRSNTSQELTAKSQQLTDTTLALPLILSCVPTNTAATASDG